MNLGENDKKKIKKKKKKEKKGMKQTNLETIIEHKELFTWREKEWT